MNTVMLEGCHWSRRRWWTLIVLVFAAHLGLIFAFSDRNAGAPRAPAFAPTLHLVPGYDEILALTDPTLFALPNRNGFAGATWLRPPDVELEPFRWTEPPRLLALPVDKLGNTFTRFVTTNRLSPFELDVKPAPEPALPLTFGFKLPLATRSTLRLGGGLANRHWLNPPILGPWPASDLLTNSVLQVMVNARGDVVSATLMPPGSGLPEADQFALETAKAARFEPLRNGAMGPTVGTLIFQWYTVPKTETNATTLNP